MKAKTKVCKKCQKAFSKSPHESYRQFEERINCSTKCSMTGRVHSKESLEKNRLAHVGKKLSLSARQKLSDMNKGASHYNWKGGTTSMSVTIRRSLEYRLWRESVFKRDNWTCVWCGKRGAKLNADHIKAFAYFPELRFAIDNGRTLCVPCHKKTDNYAGKGHKRNKSYEN